MAKTLDELLADLNEYVGTDTAKADEVATALRERMKIVSQPLINVGAKLGKRDATGKAAQVQAQLDAAKDELETVKGELAGLKERTPNVRDIEESEKRKWEPRIKQERERADKAEANAKKLREQVFRDKFAAHLTRSDGANVRMDDDPLLIRALTEQYIDRYVQREDGTEDVLQIDNDTPYDGRTTDDKIAALADAARRKVPAKYLIAATDTGSGVRPTNGSTMGGNLFSQDQIIEKKRQDPAFAGL